MLTLTIPSQWDTQSETQEGKISFIMKYFSVIRKYEILSFATIYIDIENIMLSKISQEKLETF